MIINITNKTKYGIDKNYWKKIMIAAAEKSGAERKSEINLVLISNKEIMLLNEKYRNKNGPTDVLAFGRGDEKKFIFPPDGVSRAGDIFISPDVVRKNALKYGINSDEEMRRVLIHGVLHLFGYDHEAGSREAKRMKSIENKILNLMIGVL